MAEIQRFLPQQPGHPAGVSEWPACRSLSFAQSGLPFPSEQGAEMFWSPLRTAALRTGPAFHHVPLWGHKEEEAPKAAALSRGTVAVLPACCPRLPWDLLYGFSESSACRRPSLHLQCKSKLCKPQLPAHITPIHMAAQPQQAGGDREHITVQPTEALKPCIRLFFLHVLWFSQLEIFLTEQDVIPVQGKPLRQAVVFSLRHFNNPSWKEVIWEALTTF